MAVGGGLLAIASNSFLSKANRIAHFVHKTCLIKLPDPSIWRLIQWLYANAMENINGYAQKTALYFQSQDFLPNSDKQQNPFC